MHGGRRFITHYSLAFNSIIWPCGYTYNYNKEFLGHMIKYLALEKEVGGK